MDSPRDSSHRKGRPPNVKDAGLPQMSGGGEKEKDEEGVKGDALREVLLRAV